MSDHLGWAPRAATHRSSSSGASLGAVSSAGSSKEFVAPKGMIRVCAKCRKNRLAARNAGPCQPCRTELSRKGRRFSTKQSWCLEVPVGTPLPLPADS